MRSQFPFTVLFGPPTSSLGSGSSFIPRLHIRKPKYFINPSYWNWLGRYLPSNVRNLDPNEMPFIPSPFTNDLPYMAWYDVRTPGLSGNRAFGERDTGMDEGARRAHRRWCEFGVRLSLGRIHLGLQRGEGEDVWRRRLRASLRLNGIRELIADLPNLRGDDEQRYTTLIDTFIQRARDFEMGPLYEEVTRPGSNPARLRYIQDRYIRPSLPDLHFTNVNNRFTLCAGKGWWWRRAGLAVLSELGKSV